MSVAANSEQYNKHLWQSRVAPSVDRRYTEQCTETLHNNTPVSITYSYLAV